MSRVSIGPEPTQRQQEQRDQTELAVAALREAGFKAKVTYLVCGSRFPNSDAAMITIEVTP